MRKMWAAVRNPSKLECKFLKPELKPAIVER